jgi:hypothetical protein
MDVSDIHGSSLESMVNAVENSCVVLMCVSEKYRQSINRQSEAQYAYKMGRPIIPCIMQKGYENVTGWLGIIMGDKIFINFMKYKFDECIRRLKGEVDVHYKYEKVKTAVVTESSLGVASSNDEVVQKKENPTLKWDAEQVENWFQQNELCLNILEHLNPCDGEMLHQM